MKALPQDDPWMLTVFFSFVMLGFGGVGGIIHMSYQVNAPSTKRFALWSGHLGDTLTTARTLSFRFTWLC